MKSAQTDMKKGARGTTIVSSTGPDASSMGDKSTATIKNSGFKGGVSDASSSIAGAKTR